MMIASDSFSLVASGGSWSLNTSYASGVSQSHCLSKLPFGEELTANVGGRTTNQGYGQSDGVRQKFTGQERDAETGLDYMKARYFSSVQGRFTSPDPMPIKKRHLLDPRDLNRYAYVANNPLKYVDPTGLEKILVIVRTFIPAERVTFPPVTGQTFKGDYNKGERVSHRTEQRILIETDPRKANANQFQYSNHAEKTVRTEALGRFQHMEGVGGAREARADGSSLHIGATRNGNGSVTVDARGNEANPLAAPINALSPGITYNFNINIQSEGADGRVGVTVSGQHDGFPAYEIIVERPESGNSSTPVYSHNPNVTGDTPASLFGSGEYYPNNDPVVIEPQRRRRQ